MTQAINTLSLCQMAAHTDRNSTLQDLKVVHEQIVQAHNRSPHSTLGSRLTPTEVFLGKYSNPDDSEKFMSPEDEAMHIRDAALIGHRKVLVQMQRKIANHNDSVADTFTMGDVVAVLEPKCIDTKKKNIPLSLCAVADIVRLDEEKFNHYFLRWRLTSTKRRDVRKGRVSTTSWNGKFLMRVPTDVNVNRLITKILDENVYEVRHIFCRSQCSGEWEYLVCFSNDSIPLSRWVPDAEISHLLHNYPDIPDATCLAKEACTVICRMFGAQGIGPTAEALKRAIRSTLGATDSVIHDATIEEDPDCSVATVESDVDTEPEDDMVGVFDGIEDESAHTDINAEAPINVQPTPYPVPALHIDMRAPSTVVATHSPAATRGKGRGKQAGKGKSPALRARAKARAREKAKGLVPLPPFPRGRGREMHSLKGWEVSYLLY
jgi:hypothetical protein